MCPEKVGKIAFFVCSEIKKYKFNRVLLRELKSFLAIVKVLLNAGTVNFQIIWLKKNGILWENG